MKDIETKIFLLFVFVLAALFLIRSSNDSSKIEKLEEQIESLEEQYYSLEDEYLDALSRCENPLITLYLYFEENEASFSEAKDAFNIIDSELSQFY